MIFNKKGSTLLIIFLIFIISLNIVCASDIDNQSTNKTLNSFSDLNNLINSSTDTLIELEDDYQYSPEDKFTQGIVINKSCTIDGKGHTIDAKHSSKIFKITVDGVVLKNINFINGKTSDDGVVDFDFHSGEINSCNFSGNSARNGGALYMGKGIVSDCNFINNIAIEEGGAIEFRYNYVGVVTNSNFINNSAKSSGAIHFDTSGNVLNCNFINNVASEYAGAIYFRWADGNDVVNCSFINNIAGTNGGAVYSMGDYGAIHKKYFQIENSNFINNIADAGGALYLDEMKISNSNFLNNKANQGNSMYYYLAVYPTNVKINGYAFDGSDVDSDEIYKTEDSPGPVIYIPKKDTQLIVGNLSFAFNDAKKLVITLKDENGYLLSSKNITISLNGKTYQKNTDSNGQVAMLVELDPNTYIVGADFAGDDIFNNCSLKSKITVSKVTPKIVSKKFNSKTKKYAVILKDNKGKAIKNLKVTLKINKKTYTQTTNTKGVVSFKITKKGTFKGIIKTAKTKYYTSINKTLKIVAK